MPLCLKSGNTPGNSAEVPRSVDLAKQGDHGGLSIVIVANFYLMARYQMSGLFTRTKSAGLEGVRSASWRYRSWALVAPSRGFFRSDLR